jgi:hypothetical protein
MRNGLANGERKHDHPKVNRAPVEMDYGSDTASRGSFLASSAGDSTFELLAWIGRMEWRLRFARGVATVVEFDAEIRLAAAPATARTNRTADTIQTPPTTHRTIFMVRPFC